MSEARVRALDAYGGGTCDWGGCDADATAERWGDDQIGWLPVCDRHGGQWLTEADTPERPA